MILEIEIDSLDELQDYLSYDAKVKIGNYPVENTKC